MFDFQGLVLYFTFSAVRKIRWSTGGKGQSSQRGIKMGAELHPVSTTRPCVGRCQVAARGPRGSRG